MALFGLTERSIFFKIYAGLLLVCMVVAFFTYVFLMTINEVRLQTYREHMISGMFYLLEEEIALQPVEVRDFWLNDASNLFGDNFSLVNLSSTQFKAKELARLEQGKTVVRHNNDTNHFVVFHRTDTPDVLLKMKITQIGDRQARAMMIILLQDLSNYSTLSAKKVRLEELSQKLGYTLGFQRMQTLSLDEGQMRRLSSNDMVISYHDGNANQSSTMTVIAPSGVSDLAIVVGPIELFHWFPANLLISAAFIAMLLVSLGIYALIYPLELRLGRLQEGVDKAAAGDLSAKVQVVGQDDIARLAMTFNNMIAHIRRLIDMQRELTRAVSHELRTPVARIRFGLDILADTEDAGERDVQRQEIDEDIEALNKLIDEILTYAKLEEGSPKLHWEMVDLGKLVEQVVKETNGLGHPIAIHSHTPSKTMLVMAERRYLHRVLQNFATNAVRYAKSQVIVSAFVEKGRAIVCVEDDGQGVDEKDRDKVFLPFARLDDSRTRASGGYGLGLAIVSQIAFWFNGEARVEYSRTLGGAKFLMEFPVRQIGVTVSADENTQASVHKKIIAD